MYLQSRDWALSHVWENSLPDRSYEGLGSQWGNLLPAWSSSVMSTEPNQPMGKFVTRYLSSQVKSTNWSNPWTSIHMGTIQPRRRTQRKSKEGYLCAVFVCVVWEVHRPTIADNGDPVAVSLCGLHGPATSAYSKEIPGKLLACCVSVWNASARRSRIILKGTWLTAQTIIGELSGLFIGIRAPRGYPDCLKTVPAVSVSNSYQRIFGYSNYPPRLNHHHHLCTK